ncbi:hypothetical protein STEG23_020745, partial [Scotinomys teguina]
MKDEEDEEHNSNTTIATTTITYSHSVQENRSSSIRGKAVLFDRAHSFGRDKRDAHGAEQSRFEVECFPVSRSAEGQDKSLPLTFPKADLEDTAYTVAASLLIEAKDTCRIL